MLHLLIVKVTIYINRSKEATSDITLWSGNYLVIITTGRHSKIVPSNLPLYKLTTKLIMGIISRDHCHCELSLASTSIQIKAFQYP